MKSLKELIKKKMHSGDMMSEKSKPAMENVLKELEDLADQGIAGKLSKVTVASDSPEGLEEGLEMAKDTVEDIEQPSEDSADYDMMDMDEEAKDAKKDERDDFMAEESDSEHDCGMDMGEDMDMDEDYSSYDADELEEKIKKLQAMKDRM